MSYEPKRYNGIKRRSVLRARGRILREVEKKGSITNARAKKVGKFSQVWFHLKALEAEGFLEHGGYNNWVLAKRGRGRPKQTLYSLGPRR